MTVEPIQPPQSPEVGDHDVRVVGQGLAGRRVALLVSGGIAAMKAPLLARALRRQQAEVVCYASAEALRYTTRDALTWASTHPVVGALSPDSEHLAASRPFDLYLVAPATYNTINKCRHGIADGPLTTTLASALGLMARGRAKVMLVPTMHGTMHNPVLHDSLVQLQAWGVSVMRPRDAHGKHNLPEIDAIVSEACRVVSSSPLKGARILVTAGPTPVPIDGVRRITNKFRGTLGIEIAGELHRRGAEVTLLLGSAAMPTPTWLNVHRVSTFAQYRDTVLEHLATVGAEVGIFAAAVADYAPSHAFEGKLRSGDPALRLDLRPTQKVVDLVQQAHPALQLVSFKFEIGCTLDDLVQIGQRRLDAGHAAVILNRQEDYTDAGMHRAYLLSASAPLVEMESKREIAVRLAEHLERTRRPASRAS
ncbi:phosphopantothenoylcysteine decarboxylase domain-containing protein [Rubrivivax albus]|uniref:Phosphopantothenoylcysteine decarboxylase n=1 Tax=Rubrivivax albus TaxID=2499835 RepID=A0A3S2WX88_9BURK|nr:phosphopantothenoylcysteine decarboxylase [Rubrivivax albus]RVT48109.1 phosphopantothenoylcysteine decarboxylase [Rubrivivax albus]